MAGHGGPTERGAARSRPMVTLEVEGLCIWNSGDPVFLRPRERRLIGLLQQHSNCIVELETLVEALYGKVPVEKGRIRLRRLVADIRQRGGPDLGKRLRTIPRVGLMLVVESSEKKPRLRSREHGFGDGNAAMLDDCAAHPPMVAEPAQFKP